MFIVEEEAGVEDDDDAVEREGGRKAGFGRYKEL